LLTFLVGGGEVDRIGGSDGLSVLNRDTSLARIEELSSSFKVRLRGEGRRNSRTRQIVLDRKVELERRFTSLRSSSTGTWTFSGSVT